MAAALEEQRQGEVHRQEVEREIEERNRQAAEEARKRDEEEQKRQEEERRKQEELIRQSMELEEEPSYDTETPGESFWDTHTDETYDFGEEPYTSDSASVKDELNALRRAALDLDVDTDSLNLDNASGPRLG